MPIAESKAIVWLLIVMYGTPAGQSIIMNESRSQAECWLHFRELSPDWYRAGRFLAVCVPVEGR